MEMKFLNKPIKCLNPFFSQVNTQEQTQEIRLPDAYPDIGKVLGCWGQILIRGKEWRSTSMSANGGVMAWVMYAPEDGTQPRIIDVWIPFQCRWDFPEQIDDGVMIVHPMLSNLDGRGISARKIMVRAGIDLFAQAMSKHTMEIPTPGDIPEDIQLLTNSYPVELPMEAGEKQVQIEEIMPMTGNLQPVHKIIRYQMFPMIAEQKVISNRLVFRGQIGVKISYLTQDGAICQWDTEIPFSQFTELDQDYSTTATAWVMPVLTAMEMDVTEEQQLRIRCSIAVQYTIFDRTVMDIVEDAFSPNRDVSIKIENVRIPILLDSTSVDLPVNTILKSNVDQVEFISVHAEHPVVHVNGDGLEIRMDGQFTALYTNPDNMLTGENVRFESAVPFFSAPENEIQLWPGFPMETEVLPGSDGYTLRGNYPMMIQVYSGENVPMVTELEFGELKQPDPHRPSMILRRAGEESLWSIAKDYGSTVSAIQEANQLRGEPEKGQMLLIPIP